MYIETNDDVQFWEKEIGTEKMAKKCVVIKAENGFVVTITVNSKDTEHTAYKSNTKIFITDINPLQPISGQGRSSDVGLVKESNAVLQALEKSMLNSY